MNTFFAGLTELIQPEYISNEAYKKTQAIFDDIQFSFMNFLTGIILKLQIYYSILIEMRFIKGFN